MHILVTGGAGFIGGHLADFFIDAGHDVTTLDILEPFYDLGLKEHNIDVARQRATETDGSYEFIEGSTTDTKLVNDIVEDIDVIYHQAAQAGVRASVEEPTKVTEYNINGSQTILEAARKHDVTRVVNASSSSVYGKPEYLPYDEAHPNEPVSPYGASKLAVEHYMRVYDEVYGLQPSHSDISPSTVPECDRIWRSATSFRDVCAANPQRSTAMEPRHGTSPISPISLTPITAC